ncbi:hypothetical protein BDR04DRAFT_957699, partial [Suillus decipiens]
TGRSPHLLLPLTCEDIHSTWESFPDDVTNTLDAVVSLKTNVADTHNALLASKITQAHTANIHRGQEPTFNVGESVYLSTAHQCQDYLNGDNKCVAK